MPKKLEKIKCECDVCGKELNLTPYVFKRSKNHFCSKSCSNKGVSIFQARENNPNYRGGSIKYACDLCGKEIELTKYQFNRSKRHFCSVECKNKDISYTKEQKQKTCKNCDKDFVYSYANKEQEFCSKKCHSEYTHKLSTISCKCDHCGEELEIANSLYERNQFNFCSMECKNIFHSNLFKGENNPNYNYELTEEDRQLGRFMDGYKEWRKQVYERDNYTCQCCGDDTGGNLNAHHLDGYNWCVEKRNDIKNGTTLCEICHKEFHSIYGYKNNTKKQYTCFINNKRVF